MKSGFPKALSEQQLWVSCVPRGPSDWQAVARGQDGSLPQPCSCLSLMWLERVQSGRWTADAITGLEHGGHICLMKQISALARNGCDRM